MTKWDVGILGMRRLSALDRRCFAFTSRQSGQRDTLLRTAAKSLGVLLARLVGKFGDVTEPLEMRTLHEYMHIRPRHGLVGR